MTEKQIDAIPHELRELKQWVCYILQPRDNGKMGKPPVSPITGKLLKWTDQKNFLSFDQAVKHLKANKPGNLAGIGLIFTGRESFSGVDIDSCLKSGTLTPNAAAIIKRLNSYTEISPSGNGIRIIGRGNLPDGDNGGKHGDYEAYSAGRFLTITGNIFESRNTIRDFSSDLAWFRDTFTKKSVEKTSSPAQQEEKQSSGLLSDDEIIKIISRAKNGEKIQTLMRGAGSSEDNMSLVSLLAFYTRDPYQIERLIRSTGEPRKKWDEKRGKDNFLVYDIKRILSKYAGGTYEPRPKPQMESFSGDHENPPKPPENHRDMFNPAKATDLGNAERFLKHCGKNVRYCRGLGWLIWDGKRWMKDAEDRVNELYKSMIPAIYLEAAEAKDMMLRQSLAKWAISSERQKQISGCLGFARSDKQIYIEKADIFDGNKWLFNVQNGTIDLKTGRLREARRDDLVTKITPIVYDHAADCPTWKRFLNEIMMGDAELVSYIQRIIGYTLTGETREQCWFFLHGKGQNGKSTLVGTLSQIMGEYGIKTEVETFMASKQDRKAGAPSPDIAAMAGSRFVFASETEEGRSLAVVKIKDMTGGEPMTARQLHKDPFQFTPLWKLWISGNHRPVIKDTTCSTWRRIKLIPFLYQVPDSKKDESLPNKLNEELPGILKWAVEGCLEWQRIGLKLPAAVQDATNAYRNSQDVLAAFIAECCFIPIERAWEATSTAKNLYHAYCQWCEDTGERAVNQRRFGEALSERGFERDRAGDKTRTHIWRGVSLLNTSDPSDPSDLKNNKVSYKKEVREEYTKQHPKGSDGSDDVPDEGELI